MYYSNDNRMLQERCKSWVMLTELWQRPSTAARSHVMSWNFADLASCHWCKSTTKARGIHVLSHRQAPTRHSISNNNHHQTNKYCLSQKCILSIHVSWLIMPGSLPLVRFVYPIQSHLPQSHSRSLSKPPNLLKGSRSAATSCPGFAMLPGQHAQLSKSASSFAPGVADQSW